MMPEHTGFLRTKKIMVFKEGPRDVQRMTETAEFEDFGILSEGTLVKRLLEE